MSGQMKTEILVIGGGAAGMMAAYTAAAEGRRVTLLERNAYLGRKLGITGKGRCNLCNDCSAREVLENVTRNERFLYSALSAFPPAEVKAFFEKRGVPLKTERGRRVFPVSDRAADIVNALRFACRDAGVEILHQRAIRILTENGTVSGVETEEGTIPARAVILCTGGLSYPATGSTGDGYKLAKALGHNVTELRPSLIPMESDDPLCADLTGLTLKNVTLTIRNGGKKPVFQELGELLFTHFGLSGPLVLSASAHMRAFETERYRAEIDLKPGLEEQQLDARILRDFAAAPNKELSNVLPALLPRRLVPYVLERADIAGLTPVNSVTRTQRRALLNEIKHFTVSLTGPRPVEEAIVTSGGIAVKEVDPSTMESKLVRGLYFGGEILDVDAYTGGYNLQIAWSTGHSAGLHAAVAVEGSKHV